MTLVGPLGQSLRPFVSFFLVKIFPLGKARFLSATSDGGQQLQYEVIDFLHGSRAPLSFLDHVDAATGDKPDDADP
jgi:hypothetical protein